MRRAISGFTIVELMAVVFLMALLAGGAALTFVRPLRAARWNEAIMEVQSTDQNARTFARRFNRSVAIVIDPYENSIARREGDVTTTTQPLPRGIRIDEVLAVDRTDTSNRRVNIAISPMGASLTYAVHLRGPGQDEDQWLVFAGLSGQFTVTKDESLARSIIQSVTQTTSPQ
jgi:Tfp pilus assembly protein FimT